VRRSVGHEGVWAMRRILGRLNANRGQVLIIFVLMFSVISVVGILVVDVGIWYSERRADQTDADLPALAGARQCMLKMVTGDYGAYDPDLVVDRVWRDNVPDDPDEKGFSYTSTGCFDPTTGGTCADDSPLCCVDVVAKHKTAQLFSNLPIANHIFDDVSENMDAKARACAGAAQTAENILPAYPASQCFINAGQPNFDDYCWIAGGAHDKNCGVPGNRCWLDLASDAPQCSPGDGHKDVVEMFNDASLGADCSINPHPPTCDEVGDSGWSDCVQLTQGDSSHIESYVYNRVHTAPCDKDGNGIDDLDEVLDPQTHDPTVCPNAPEGQRTSPRLISVPVIDPPGDGTCANGEPCPIISLAAFYIAGCFDDRISQTELDNMLDGTTPLTEDQIKCTEGGGAEGHEGVLGKWVKIIVLGSGVGPANPSTTEYGIALCDWEGPGNCGGEPMPTPVPWPTSTPLGTPGPTDTPTPTTEPPTPCPTVCNPGGQQCSPECPQPPTNTPVATATRTPTRTPTITPTATPCPCGTKPNGTCNNCH